MIHSANSIYTSIATPCRYMYFFRLDCVTVDFAVFEFKCFRRFTVSACFRNSKNLNIKISYLIYQLFQLVVAICRSHISLASRFLAASFFWMPGTDDLGFDLSWRLLKLYTSKLAQGLPKGACPVRLSSMSCLFNGSRESRRVGVRLTQEATKSLLLPSSPPLAWLNLQAQAVYPVWPGGCTSLRGATGKRYMKQLKIGLSNYKVLIRMIGLSKCKYIYISLHILLCFPINLKMLQLFYAYTTV